MYAGFQILNDVTVFRTKHQILQCIANVLFLTSDNDFLRIMYSLFRGRQNIFLKIFSTKFVVMCNKNFENRLTKIKFTSKNIFE